MRAEGALRLVFAAGGGGSVGYGGDRLRRGGWEGGPPGVGDWFLVALAVRAAWLLCPHGWLMLVPVSLSPALWGLGRWAGCYRLAIHSMTGRGARSAVSHVSDLACHPQATPSP